MTQPVENSAASHPMVGFLIPMLPLKAHVQNGQIVLDEPADLPEGAALTVVIDEDDSDDMTPEERAQLRRALDAGFQAFREGRFVDGDEIVHRLLARP